MQQGVTPIFATERSDYGTKEVALLLFIAAGLQGFKFPEHYRMQVPDLGVKGIQPLQDVEYAHGGEHPATGRHGS